MTAPPTTSECPPRYFVVLWTTRSAPSASGCCRYGEAKVLSTASTAPARCATWAMAAMSRTCGRGVVGVAGRQPPGPEDALQEPVGAAVEVGRGDHLVAGLQQRQHRRRGRQPGGEGQPALAALQRGYARLQGGAGRVAAARVLVALVLPGGRLGV